MRGCIADEQNNEGSLSFRGIRDTAIGIFRSTSVQRLWSWQIRLSPFAAEYLSPVRKTRPGSVPFASGRGAADISKPKAAIRNYRRRSHAQSVVPKLPRACNLACRLGTHADARRHAAKMDSRPWRRCSVYRQHKSDILNRPIGK